MGGFGVKPGRHPRGNAVEHAPSTAPGRTTRSGGEAPAHQWDGKPYKGTVFPRPTDHAEPTAESGSAASQRAAQTDPLLVSECRQLHFPKTVVGQTSVQSIVLRNDDAREIALDALSAVRGDLFDEVHAQLDGTLTFHPGERREIPIQFRPARAAHVAHDLQVITGFGPAGPESDIHVTGEGIDLPYAGERSGDHTSSTSSVGTEVRIEEQKREIADSARTQDQLARQRARSAMLVEQWRTAAVKYNHSIAQWTLANWIDFLGKTGGDHVLHGSAEIVDSWKKLVTTQTAGGIKKGMGEGTKKVLEYAKKSATVALVLENPLFGFAIGEAVNRLADFITDKIGLKGETPEEKSDAHALEATRSTGRAGVQKTEEILGYESRANLAIEDTSSAALVRIAHAETAEELGQWQAWAKSELSNVPRPIEDKGRQFSDELLRHWVLEHAGTTQSANASTNKKAWTAARDELTKKGMLESLERTDLFIHQCRLEWGSLGLVETDHIAAELDAERRRLEAQLREWGNPDSAVASMICNAFGGGAGHFVGTFHRTIAPKQAAATFGKLHYLLGPDVDGLRLFTSEFFLDCRILVKNEGNGVIVRSFSYDLRGLGRQYTYLDRSPEVP